MELKNYTILITGGSSGLGLEMAKIFVKDNKVLICGRSLDKLKKVKSQYSKIEYFQCNLSEVEGCNKLYEWVKMSHPDCNVLINNAAMVNKIDFSDNNYSNADIVQEIKTNFTAPIILSKLFINLIQKNKNPVLINISSGLAYVPRAVYPLYNATKAGLHSFSQTLRHQMKDSKVVIIEVFFPAVETPWHKGNPPSIAISPQAAIKEMLLKLKKGKTEIRVGKVKQLYLLSRIMPSLAFKKINSL